MVEVILSQILFEKIQFILPSKQMSLFQGLNERYLIADDNDIDQRSDYSKFKSHNYSRLI